MRTSSLGLRVATATVRVFASTTTPSGVSPTLTHSSAVATEEFTRIPLLTPA